MPKTIDSILKQNKMVSGIYIIDDCSDTYQIPKDISKNCKIVRNTKNRGRGYCRNIGIDMCSSDYVLFCDSSNSISENFISDAIAQFKDDDVAAVYGRITGTNIGYNSCNRWRERHLFLETKPGAEYPYEIDSLSSYSVILRRSHVIKVGNFNKDLRQFEDQELGKRLFENNFKIIFHPGISCISNKNDSLLELAKRINRWYSPTDEKLNFKGIISILKTSILIWLKKDLGYKDYKCGFISIIIPFLIIIRHII